jgi:hypothetical protein
VDLGSDSFESVAAFDLSPSMGEEIYQLDPLVDSRWPEFIARHPRSSVYHTQPWLEALKRTYGYMPVAYTTSPPGFELTNGIVFCQIESWLTGRRIVSLPFSDHCDPLVGTEDAFEMQTNSLLRAFRMQGWKYTELRPRSTIARVPRGLQPARHYCFHSLDLSPE